MAVCKSTSLSAGLIIYSILHNDPEVKKRVKKIYPVAADKAELPYVVYRRADLSQDNVKGKQGADSISIEIFCYTANYSEGLVLAEAIREALDHRSAELPNGMRMRSCYLDSASERWADDAYEQALIFNIKI